MTHSSPSNSRRAKSTSGRRRWLVRSGLVLLIVIGLGIGALPWILSMGPGRIYVQRMLQRQVDGTVNIERVTMRWRGPHHVQSIDIHDHDGRLVGQMDAWLHASLWSVLTGLDRYDLRVRGELHSYVEDDGTVQLVPLREAMPQPDDPGRIALPTMPLRLTLDGVAWTLHQGDVNALALHDIAGDIDLMDAAALSAQVQAVAVRDDVRGEVRFIAHANDLFLNVDRSVSPNEADLGIELELTALPLVLDGHRHDFEDLVVRIVASNVADAVLFTVTGQRVPGSFSATEGTGAVEIAVRWDTPVSQDGSLHPDPALWSGSMALRDMPTVVVMPLLAQVMDFRADEIGPLFSLDGAFGAGESRAYHMHWDSQNLQARVRGTADQAGGRLIIEDSQIGVVLQPQRIAQWTGWQALEPVPVRVVVHSGSITPPGWGMQDQRGNHAAISDERPWWRTLVMQGGFDTFDTHTLIPPDGSGAVEVGLIRLDLQIALADEGLLELEGSTSIDQGNLRIDQRITNFLNQRGEMDLARAQPVGLIELQHVPLRLLDHFLDLSELPTLADSRLDAPADIDIQTHVHTGAADDGGMLHMRIRYSSEDMVADALLIRSTDGSEFRVDDAIAQAMITPVDVESLLGAAPPVRLLEPASLQFTFAPATIRYSSEHGIRWPMQFAGSVSSGDALKLAYAETGEHMGVHAIDAAWQYDVDLKRTNLDLGALLADSSGASVAQLSGTLAVADGQMTWELSADDVDSGRAAAMLGDEALAWHDWLGERGSMQARGVSDAKHEIDLTADFPRFAGAFSATMEEEHVTLRGASSRWEVARQHVRELLIPMSDESGPGSPVQYRVSRDVPMQLTVHEVTLPLSAWQEGTPASTRSATNMQISGGPIRVREEHPSGAVADPNIEPLVIFDGLTLTMISTDLQSGVAIDFAADVSGRFLDSVPLLLSSDDPANEGVETQTATISGSRDTAAPERIEFRGVLGGLVPEEDAMDSGIHLTGTLSGGAFPTAIFDAHGDLNGLLTAAVGDAMRVTLAADAFSAQSGRIDGRIETPQGFVAGALLGRDGAMVVDTEFPIEAELELTRAFRDRILQSIHPLFADVRSTENPIRARVTEGRIPLDGDVGDLDATMRIEVGAVEFTSGSLLLGVLQMFDTERGVVPGFIEPVHVRIQDGIVSYERFIVHVDKYALAYEGSIDLNTRQMSMRTELPGASLARTFRELAGFIDTIVIPFRISGPIEQPKVEIDPSFDLAAAAIEAGVRGVVEREIPDLIKPIGDLLDSIFRKKK